MITIPKNGSVRSADSHVRETQVWNLLRQDGLQRDVETLLGVRIRRISLFDINKHREEMEQVKAALAETRGAGCAGVCGSAPPPIGRTPSAFSIPA